MKAAAKRAADSAKAAKAAASRAEAAANEAAKQIEAATSDVASKVYRFVAIWDLAVEAGKDANEAEKAAKEARLAADEVAKASSAANQAEILSKAREAVEDAEQCVNRAREAVKKALKARSEANQVSQAAVLAELVLPVKKFFETYKPKIYENLEKCDEIAQKAKANGDLIFVVESLPIIYGIIHVGATREELNGAIKWVRDNWGEITNSLNVLSTLVFHYVVDRGVEEFSNNDDKAEIWKRIKERVERKLS